MDAVCGFIRVLAKIAHTPNLQMSKRKTQGPLKQRAPGSWS